MHSFMLASTLSPCLLAVQRLLPRTFATTTASTSPSSLTVGVSGLGTAGAAAALLLARSGASVTIFEAHPEYVLTATYHQLVYPSNPINDAAPKLGPSITFICSPEVVCSHVVQHG